jgi:glycosyltransferase involved in cell wall biosynthesis/folate-dependent phosphoribosylglycinamide formyltransferase PurN
LLNVVIFTKNKTNAANRKLFELLSTDPEIKISACIVDCYRKSSPSIISKIKKIFSLSRQELLFKLTRKLKNISVSISESLKINQHCGETAFKKLADAGIKIIYTDDINSEKTLQNTKELHADLGIICGGRILREELIKTPVMGSLNIHKRKLPEYRGGGAPLYWEARNGEKETAVTIHYAEKQVDCGNIISEQIIKIGEYENLTSAKIKADSIGCFLYYGTIRKFIHEKPEGTKQDTAKGYEYNYAGEYEEYRMNKTLRRKSLNMPRFKLRKKSLSAKVMAELKYLICLPVLFLKKRSLAKKGLAPISVFFYHTVGNNRANRMMLPLDIFAEQINFLRKNYEIISLTEAKNRLKNGSSHKQAAVITFDDGYAEDLNGTIPFLRTNNIPATFFTSTGNCIEQQPFKHDAENASQLTQLSAGDIKSISDWGFEIGSHGVYHEKFSILRADAAADIMQQGRRDIEKITRRNCTSFSFPYGIIYKDFCLQNQKTADSIFNTVCHAWGGYNYPSEQQLPILRISAPDNRRGTAKIMNGYTGIKETLKGNSFGTIDREKLEGFIKGAKLRVAFIETGSGEGGSTYSLLRILETIEKDYTERITPLIITITEKAAEVFKSKNFNVRHIKAKGTIRRFLECRKILQKEGIEHIHCNNPPYEHIPFIAAAATLLKPCTLHFRVSRPVTRAESFILKFTKHIFTVSKSGIRAVKEKLTLPEDRLSLLGDGVIISDYEIAAQGKIRNEFNIAPDTFMILLPATLQPGKGQDTAVEAAEILKEKGLAVKWLFAGAEHYQFSGFKEELSKMIEQKELSRDIILTDHRSDIPDLLSDCNLVIMPSRLTEGTPCAIMEAFAAGKPVIAADSGGMKEAVNSDSGEIIETLDSEKLASAVETLYNNRTLLEEKCRGAKRTALEKYDIRVKTEKILNVILDL